MVGLTESMVGTSESMVGISETLYCDFLVFEYE